jgi:thioredoxin reductase
MTPTARNDWDVVIVGAGPAGLSAALILGRCRRRVLLTDGGSPRNWAAHRMHGFLSRDGADLDRFRAVSFEQLQAYTSVTFVPVEVSAVNRETKSAFGVQLADGCKLRSRKVLLASGVFDQLPGVPGIEQYYGKSVHACPYCEGWEMRNWPIAIYGKGSRGFEMTRAVSAWSSDLLLCTNGPARLSTNQRHQLQANHVEIVTEKIAELLGEDGQLAAIRFANGQQRSRRALFFDTQCLPQSRLADALGCRMTRDGSIHCRQYEASSVPGIYAAGNILKDVQLSIVAAAEGARAAFGINRSLTREDFGLAASQR